MRQIASSASSTRRKIEANFEVLGCFIDLSLRRLTFCQPVQEKGDFVDLSILSHPSSPPPGAGSQSLGYEVSYFYL
jgi:hypothetical protein